MTTVGQKAIDNASYRLGRLSDKQNAALCDLIDAVREQCARVAQAAHSDPAAAAIRALTARKKERAAR